MGEEGGKDQGKFLEGSRRHVYSCQLIFRELDNTRAKSFLFPSNILALPQANSVLWIHALRDGQ